MPSLRSRNKSLVIGQENWKNELLNFPTSLGFVNLFQIFFKSLVFFFFFTPLYNATKYVIKISNTTENMRKSLVFWCFPGVQKDVFLTFIRHFKIHEKKIGITSFYYGRNGLKPSFPRPPTAQSPSPWNYRIMSWCL